MPSVILHWTLSAVNSTDTALAASFLNFVRLVFRFEVSFRLLIRHYLLSTYTWEQDSLKVYEWSDNVVYAVGPIWFSFFSPLSYKRSSPSSIIPAERYWYIPLLLHNLRKNEFLRSIHIVSFAKASRSRVFFSFYAGWLFSHFTEICFVLAVIDFWCRTSSLIGILFGGVLPCFFRMDHCDLPLTYFLHKSLCFCRYVLHENDKMLFEKVFISPR